ncbi:HAD family hydrolase [Paenibacillus hexagrammi]|uniref:HAD family phosphatase n=1 Tax=Paenibacillus hexagrammi TaxID=2908839 RepID=A0ABY3SFP9_9BACL|nr:HAD family phosphatase [Paenibacillus sp. YPD9-1]UJF31752.1 HAD family phosphatase [Paenibacillus sp. YPD9-1]
MRQHDVDAVIFDMDGVLVDTEPLYFQVEQQSFRHFGIKMDEAEHHGYVGVTLESMWSQIRVKHGLEVPVQELLAYHKSNVLQFISAYPDLQPMPHVEAWIQWLKKQNIPIIVASSSPLPLIELILQKAGLAPYFPIKVSGESMAKGKPEPDIFLHAASVLGTAPAGCLVIEDSTNGVKAAKAAGMLCVGLKNPNSGNQDVSQADFKVSGFKELFQLPEVHLQR